MRNLLSTVLLLALAASLPAWAGEADQNQDFFPGMGEPGSGTTIIYSGNGAYMGIDVQDITGERVGPLKLKEERGAEVVMVDQDAPAGKAGIKEHDVILEFNGTKVEGCEQLRRLIHETPAGRTVAVGISRDGQPLTLQVQLADRLKATTHVMRIPPVTIPRIQVPEFDVPMFDISVHSARAGVQVENLTPQLGEFFGVKGGDGVLVRSVDKGGPAEGAGLKAGDVVVRVENEKITNRNDWNMAIRSHTGGKVTLGVVRDKHEQNFSLTIPERSKDHSWLWGPEKNLDLDDMEIEIDRNDLQKIKAAARESAAQIREQVKKELAANRDSLNRSKAEWERQLKPEFDKLRQSLEEMRRELYKSLREL